MKYTESIPSYYKVELDGYLDMKIAFNDDVVVETNERDILYKCLNSEQRIECILMLIFHS